ncbi:copper chaperone PCu(A)C [Deinococcus navajonensis]|uniref:Copper chaperone PCu(A)C n=1 Tax=Deinococcus navajonensis TaxID=309884 RepID=A0ABV8XQF2_9DEIO
MSYRLVLALSAGLLAVLPVAAGHAAHSVPAPSVRSVSPVRALAAQVVAVPPVITETSAFVSLHNPGARPVVLRAVSTPVAAHSMLMVTRRDAQGRSGMQTVTRLTVAARSTLKMGPDGTHVMLMGLKRPLKVGERLPLTLSFADGQTVKVQATVRRP